MSVARPSEKARASALMRRSMWTMMGPDPVGVRWCVSDDRTAWWTAVCSGRTAAMVAP